MNWYLCLAFTLLQIIKVQLTEDMGREGEGEGERRKNAFYIATFEILAAVLQ